MSNTLQRRRLGTALVATLASGLLLAGCASGGAGDTGRATEAGAVGIIGDQPAGGDPVDGGALSFAAVAPVTSLDPTKTQPTGASGGNQMAAVYDLLMRYDSATDSYEPQLAKSLEVSDDDLTWTLKLRDGVTFSDGSPLDAKAVVASIDRFNAGRGANAEAYQKNVTSAEAADAATVVFTLDGPWSEFPALLTAGHGMIVAPAAYAAEGQFAPIGAGPFTFESMTPGSDLVLKANAGYWGGKPHLSTLKFVDIQGEQPKIDALKTDGVQMGQLRGADTINIAKASFPGYLETVSMFDVGQINAREGRPGSDVRVRKAMALAIDPEVINQRARAGEGMPGSEMFQAWSRWHSDVPGLTQNVDEAKRLLDEAKADGYNGRINYVSRQGPDAQAVALAAQSMLESIGFSVEITYVPSLTDLFKVQYVTHDFDLATGGISVADAAPYLRLFTTLDSTSVNNVGGYADPKIDAQLATIKAAPNDDDKRAALAELQTMVNETVPFLNWSAGQTFTAWTDNVHGVKPSMFSILLYDKAWVA